MSQQRDSLQTWQRNCCKTTFDVWRQRALGCCWLSSALLLRSKFRTTPTYWLRDDGCSKDHLKNYWPERTLDRFSLVSRWRRRRKPKVSGDVAGVFAPTAVQGLSIVRPRGGSVGKAVPALEEIMLDGKLVEHFADDLIQKILDRLRAMVKGRYRREHDGSRQCNGFHIAYVY